MMMKRPRDSTSLMAVFLVLFLIVVGVTVWLLDFSSQQRVFGLLVSAMLVAFAILAYFYYVDDPKDLNRKWITAGFVTMAVFILLAASLFAGVGTAPVPNVSITIYSGEISDSLYGFGNSATSLTSPGPTLAFKVGDIVNIALVNVGQMPHNWAIVSANQSDASVLFRARIASDSAPLQTNQSASIIFTASQAGTFYYICQVDAHLQLGMWGSVVITP
jgi:plastocyanin